MHEIKIKVNGDGTINTGSKCRLQIGVENEINRVKFVFELDETIEGTYHYIKFLKDSISYIYRVYNKQIIINRSIFSDPGIWTFCFISSDNVIVNKQITGDYAFISEPVEAVILKGILQKGNRTESEDALDSLCSMNFSKLIIPSCVTSIGDYFLYDPNKTFDVEIGSGVTSIGKYAFYHAVIPTLTFTEDSSLTTMKEYALYSITFENDIVLPNTITSWGKYTLNKSSGKKVSFQKGCNLPSMGSYAFWTTKFTELELPDGLQTLSGNTYVIKDNTELTRIWIPKSITTAIPANAIFGNGSLTTIELEDGFNISANFSSCTYLTAECMEKMFLALKNLNGQTAKSLTLGLDNLAKLTQSQLEIATNKNWTLS